jgi:fatty-acid desaturase
VVAAANKRAPGGRLSAGTSPSRRHFSNRTLNIRRLRSYFRPATFPFWSVHVAAVGGVIACGASLRWFGLAVAAYFAPMLLVTAAYHRYFSHRAFKTSRPFQLLLALGAQSNNHHRYPSSARQGFRWWEIDLTLYVLLAQEKLGVIWDVRRPPPTLLCAPR